MASGTAEKSASKLILFNHSKNPYHLRDGKDAEGKAVKRIFKVGDSIECLDQAEFDMLREYRGVSTTKQVAPGVAAVIEKLEAEKAAMQVEIDELKAANAKFKK